MQAAGGPGSRVASLVFRSVPLADPLARRRLTWGLLVLLVAAIPWLWPQPRSSESEEDCTANFEDRWHSHPPWAWRLDHRTCSQGAQRTTHPDPDGPVADGRGLRDVSIHWTQKYALTSA